MSENEKLEEVARIHNARQPNTYARGIGEMIGTLIGAAVGVSLLFGVLGGCLYMLRALWRTLAH